MDLVWWATVIAIGIPCGLIAAVINNHQHPYTDGVSTTKTMYLTLAPMATDHPERRTGESFFKDEGLRNALIGLNTTHLRGQDIRRLQGLTLHTSDPDNVLVRGRDFESKGNLTFHKNPAVIGCFTGDLSFHVPGLDAPAEGTFISVDHTSADENTKAGFEKLHAHLLEGRPKPDLAEVVKNLASQV